MAIELRIPKICGQYETVYIEAEKTLYVIGANGSGKSSLFFYWAGKHRDHCELIAGNREVNFSNSAVTQSPNQTNQHEKYKHQFAANSSSRTEKSHANDFHRLAGLLARIESGMNYENRQLRDAHNKHDSEKMEALRGDTLLDKINSIISAARLPLKIGIDQNTTYQVTRPGGAVYEIKLMSDGERAALILAMEVLLADNGRLILIDEPERHLHRSISEPLLSKLRAMRPDLHFVIATHDMSLVRSDRKAQILALYEYDGAQKWRVEPFGDWSDLPKVIVDGILGAREKVLFVEGSDSSIDLPLYKILFPDEFVVPAGNCRAVREAVAGMRRQENLGHIVARGIIDGDSLCGDLPDGLSRLKVYSAEALYYHKDVMAMVADHMGKDRAVSETAELRAFEFLGRQNIEYFIKDTAYKHYRSAYEVAMPQLDAYRNEPPAYPNGEVIYQAVLSETQGIITSKDWAAVCRCINLKNVGLRNCIAKEFGLGDYIEYEQQALRMIQSNVDLQDTLRALIV